MRRVSTRSVRQIRTLEKVRQIGGIPKHDLYYARVKTYRRHKDCNHDPPCQARFRCNSEFHKGSRATPWCTGCYDEIDRRLDGICDDCWVKEDEKLGSTLLPEGVC